MKEQSASLKKEKGDEEKKATISLLRKEIVPIASKCKWYSHMLLTVIYFDLLFIIWIAFLKYLSNQCNSSFSHDERKGSESQVRLLGEGQQAWPALGRETEAKRSTQSEIYPLPKGLEGYVIYGSNKNYYQEANTSHFFVCNFFALSLSFNYPLPVFQELAILFGIERFVRMQ